MSSLSSLHDHGQTLNSLKERAGEVLGQERLQVCLRLPILDLHRTYSAAYQCFQDDLAVALGNIITVRNCSSGPINELQSESPVVQALREKNLQRWSSEGLDAWFAAWIEALMKGESNE